MTFREIKIIHNRILTLIDQRELLMALKNIDKQLDTLNSYQLKEKRTEIGNIYRFMSDYLMQGINDPDQPEVYRKLILNLYDLADNIKSQLELKEEHSCHCIQRNKYVFSELSLKQCLDVLHLYSEEFEPSEDLQKRYEQVNKQLFNVYWLNNYFDSEGEKDFLNIQIDAFVPNDTKLLLVSAMSLSLLEFFDENKFFVLMDTFSNSDNEKVRQRVLVSLVLALYMHDNRVRMSPFLQKRLVLFFDDEDILKNVKDIVLQLLMSKQTEAVTRKMNEEILPKLRVMTERMSDKIDLQTLKEQIEDKNPEWLNTYSNDIVKKLDEYTQMQMEGTDVYMATFSSLKVFPFFDEISNWFLPFSMKNTEVSSVYIKEDRSLFDILIGGSFFCDSDMYSMSIFINSVPESQRKETLNMFRSQSDDLSEMKDMMKEKDKLEKVSNYSNLYIQDLYRFFNLFKYKEEFKNIFAGKFDFSSLWIFEALDKSKELENLQAEFYFAKALYKEALEYFRRRFDKGGEIGLLQKIAYSEQMLGNFDKAIDYYKRSELLNGESVWLYQKMAYCFRMISNYEEAYNYYELICRMQPDNLKNKMNLGHCCLELGNYDEALKYFYEVSYTDEKHFGALKGIAWTHFLQGKFDQAMQEYQVLPEGEMSPVDITNMGHIEWCNKKRQNAVAYYKKAAGADALDAVINEIEKDKEILLSLGISKDEYCIMLDYLRREEN